ncbi:UDP-N-acetylmuramate--L-alanine ligase [Anaerococcus prevotii]|uniref:UDP-N-acetylmuramate--L-alanine ligase n=1 Tax=Anaerococcus prevotii (strain ATCC 9321 / DSM 20548 / JCM 6508 / NCTC 11806 / PC1) TaxID=525919 RepID=C7RHP0_ANAPD|nr:UDP-N-acetylmuramate--L-alanine ligase [Anaerococcus prevotii]ACV29001.1 UDP-N-acetylmuramate/alanine ligase [Anaerococcus prevotii DSM 20548]SUU94674.1 UDP-N-acetylmuramate--L-alanine ligase [Anaerococcus prevotii]
MFKFDLDRHDYKYIHFIGVGGISMSGLAQLLLAKGYEVSGSDRSDSKIINHLRELGVKISIGQKKENITNPDLVIYTDAILDDNEELIAAKKLNVPVVTRGVFLGALMRNYKNSIAVSGSHGKSTTTSMISKILMHSDKDATILLGGELDEMKGNVRVGSEEYLVTEACEYKGNIRYYYPQTLIILNIDEDHLDYYKDLDDIVDTFREYLSNQDENSMTITNLNEENNRLIFDSVKGKLITYAQENDEADYCAFNIKFDEIGRPNFDLRMRNGDVEHFELGVIGRHNINNAMASIIATYENGIDIETIRKNILKYEGLDRRMQIIGEVDDATIMTDYGHHPSEIKVTLDALKEHTKGRLICVWQPHTYSRTKALFDDFLTCFDSSDEVIITDIYAAREKFDPSIHSKDVVDALVKKGINAKYIGKFEDCRDYIYKEIKKDDLVLTTGCGNPDVLARMIVEDK